MNKIRLVIAEHKALTNDVRKLVLGGTLPSSIKAGQFLNLAVPGFFLRRPISICDADEETVSIIYKIVGNGTRTLADYPKGLLMEVLLPLGNGYDLDKAGSDPLLIGGGVGIPPLYLLAKQLRERGCRVKVVLGFNTGSERFLEDEFIQLGCSVTVATADGTYGQKGFVTDVLPEGNSFFYTCGPMPMLKAVHKALGPHGQFSLEERMGCGFGACMGCSILTKSCAKRVCKDGPVFDGEELLWND